MLALLLLLAAPPKVVFLAGPPDQKPKPGEHEYRASCEALAGLVRQSGVTAVVSQGWPADPTTLDGAAAVVVFTEGGDNHLLATDRRLARLDALAEGGTGLVFLHSAVDYPADWRLMRRLVGGVWRKPAGKRAHWVATFDRFPNHPVFNGVTPFTLDDGWLWENDFADGGRDLLRTVGPTDTARPADSGQVVAWAFERPGRGRGFVFTGGHRHDSLRHEGYRRFLTNAVLWAARQSLPDDGAPVALDPEALKRPH